MKVVHIYLAPLSCLWTSAIVAMWIVISSLSSEAIRAQQRRHDVYTYYFRIVTCPLVAGLGFRKHFINCRSGRILWCAAGPSLVFTMNDLFRRCVRRNSLKYAENEVLRIEFAKSSIVAGDRSLRNPTIAPKSICAISGTDADAFFERVSKM